MTGWTWLRIGAILGALGVILGAFGAHGLKGKLSANQLEWFETGVRYHLVHALAVVAVAIVLVAANPARGAMQAAGWGFLTGVVLFSGSLYGLALGGPRWLVFVTPIGGLAYIIGWVALAIAARPMPS